MKKDWHNCFSVLKALLDDIEVTDGSGDALSVKDGLQNAISMLGLLRDGKLVIIGNGASAAIASHMATDFWKNAGVPAVAFNDSSLLTAVSNDLGYKHVFEKPIQFFGRKGDLLMAISSSGESENILRAVSAARALGMHIITLSGFKKENPLREMGHLNFYAPSMSYGLVEVAHHAICHFTVDQLCAKRYSETEESHLQDIILKSEVKEISPRYTPLGSAKVVDISE